MRNHSALAQREDRVAIANVQRELVALDAMTVGELAEKYRAVFGIPTRSRNKEYLRKHLAWRIQERAEGGLSPRALERIEQLAPQAPVRRRERVAKQGDAERPAPATARPDRDSRLPPPGTVLTRAHDGIEHRVTVLTDGFEYQGKCHRSLSQIARLITGTSWNGFTFFLGRAAGARSDAEAVE
ncbi:MAG TPA: DUF2924 domain-containing protein [Kofleriaceae bacterium]